jgi:hypothetical protein
MPKRVIDGEALWRSDKLKLVEPPIYRAEYANLIPLALANGSFEADPHRIYANVYAFNRPDITFEAVEAILAEFEHRKMLFLWRDRSTGKQWGYWVGIGKPGRLPPASRRGEHEVLGADPPEAELRAFLSGVANGQPTASQSVANGCLGLGLGSGSGLGKTLVHSANEPGEGSLVEETEGNAPETAIQSGKLAKATRTLMATALYSKYPRKQAKPEGIKAIEKAIVIIAKRDFGGDERAAADWLGAKQDQYARSAQGSRPEKNLIPLPASWYNGGRYDDDPEEWKYAGTGNGFGGHQQTPIVAQRSPDERLNDQFRRYREGVRL